MSLFISLLSCSIEGSLGFVALVVLRIVILLAMCSGSGVWCVFIFPLGMWCLSAISIAFVRILFPVCTLVGAGLSCKVFSIAVVKSGQFALR